MWLLSSIILFNQPVYAADQSTAASARFTAVPQIMGGTEAGSGDWPWMTALLSANTTDLYAAQFCGGALIAPTWVLTAGHCVEGKTAAEIQVAVGVYDLNAWSGTRIAVKRIIAHPAYVNFYANDIALLELKTSSSKTPLTIFLRCFRAGD
jgi:secreted trypsin-like serine protease